MISTHSKVFFAAALLLQGTSAYAKGGLIFDRYRLGVSYEASTSYAQMTYEANGDPGYMPEDCEVGVSGPGRLRCTAYLAPDTEENPLPSLYLDSPFQRQGLFYFGMGLTFATISYTGGLNPKPSTVPKTSTTRRKPAVQPLQQAYLELYGINWQGYLRFGITPRYFPDLLVTAGLGLQTAGGRFKMLGDNYQTIVIQPDAFAEAELVLARFSTGAFSAFVGQDKSLRGAEGADVIEDNPQGTPFADFRLGLTTASSGLRLLFPF